MTNPPTEPVLVRIADLHPTQITVGFREVAQKRLLWRARNRKAPEQVRAKSIGPVVLGPTGALYLIDRHHLACAMRGEGVLEVEVRLIADLSALLWPALEARGWRRPYDADGRRRPFEYIPCTLDSLREDHFRSLASALRRAGGFAKKSEPFSEFAWADFLRSRISGDAVVSDFDGSLCRALVLARTPAACRLPGWRPDPALRAAVSATRGSPHAYW